MNNVIPLQNSPERVSLLPIAPGVDFATALSLVNATMFDRYGDADDFLDCFIIPARIVGGTFWD